MLFPVTLILLMILVVPIVCEKIHLPSIIGLILAGVLTGPYGLGILERDAVLVRMGEIGLLYVMFISAIEIDMSELQKERHRSMLFGLFTFLFPTVVAGLISYFLLHVSLPGSLLIGAMLGSHTLLTYPAVSRYGVQRSRAVSLVIGGTICAVTAAMLILAVVSSLYHESVSWLFWLRMSLGGIAMLLVMVWGYPRLARWFFKRYNDAITEYLFVILLAILGGGMARLAGLEPILGVFLAGLSLNRQLPNLSPLMNKINFVGNAIFIPIFLLSVGTLIDVRAFVQGPRTLLLALTMCVAALGGKWLAAWLAQRVFGLVATSRRLLFGLTAAHAAGALATVMIGYAIILPDGSHLLGEDVLSATVVMILISCTVASFVTEHAAKQMALTAMQQESDHERAQHILIPVSNPESNARLLELATTILSRRKDSTLHAMAVVRQPSDRQVAQRLLEQTAQQAAAADFAIRLHEQVAVNTSNGIKQVATAESLTHIVLGMGGSLMEPGYGKVVNPLLTTTSQGLWIYHSVQPLKTIRTVRILVPQHADAEEDYPAWKHMVGRIIESCQAEMTQELIANWKVLPRIAASLAEDELLVIVQARRSTTSYSADMDDTPRVLHRFFTQKNYVVIYPYQQVFQQENNTFLSEFTHHGESAFALYERLREKLHRTS